MADLWYYTHGGKQMEPVTAGELKAHATSGFLTPNDLVWKEGMAAWVKASTLKGLFPPGSVAPPAPKSASVQPARSKYAVDNLRAVEEIPDAEAVDDAEDLDEPRPRKRRRAEEDDDDLRDDDRGESRDIRRRSRSKPGLSGLTIGLIVGGIALVVLVGIGVAAFAMLRGGTGTAADYQIDLAPNQFHARTVSLRSGNAYEFRVTSTNRNTDVDIFVFDPRGQQVGFDETIGPDSLITLRANSSGMYRVEVRNLDMAMGSHSHVVIRNLGTGNVPLNPFQHVQGGIAPHMPNMPKAPNFPFPKNFPKGAKFGNDRVAANPIPDPKLTQNFAIPPNGTFEHTIVCPNAKQIHVGVQSDNPGNDVDVFVYQMPARQLVASDTAISHTCRTSFQAQPNTTYVIEVRNLGGFPANGSLIYTQP